MPGKCERTLSVAWSFARVHNWFVDGVYGVDTREVRVNVRIKGHDSGPDQSTVIVLRGLYERFKSRNRGASCEVAHIELDVLGAPKRLFKYRSS